MLHLRHALFPMCPVHSDTNNSCSGFGGNNFQLDFKKGELFVILNLTILRVIF